MVPRPRYHIIHFYGVLAPAAKWRSQIVPGRIATEGVPEEPAGCEHAEKGKPKPKNYRWAELLARTFAIDVLECPRCGGRMKLIAAIESPEVASKILDSMGIACRPPPAAPARQRQPVSDFF